MKVHGMVVAATACALILSGGGVAGAETVTRPDRSGDAPGGIDVTSARYEHTAKKVTVTARIPDLQRSGTASLSISRFEIFEAGYVVEIVKERGRTARTRLLYFDHFDAKKRRCSRVEGRWGRAVIRLAVPTECLKGHRTSEVLAQFGASDGRRIDRVSAVRRLRRG